MPLKHMSAITKNFRTSSIGPASVLSSATCAPIVRSLSSFPLRARQDIVHSETSSSSSYIKDSSQKNKPYLSTQRTFASQSGNGRMASPQFDIVTPELVKGIRDFWYSHVDQESLVLPSMTVLSKWFMGGAEFDGACVKHYKPALEEIRAAKLTSVEPLLKHLNSTDPIDFICLMLLLDQLPRNIYRDAESGPVYAYFDPLALSLILHIQTLSTPVFMDPKVRWQFAYRFWQTLPLSHSEDLKHHDLASELLAKTVADLQVLLDATPEEESAEPDEYRKRAIGAAKRAPEDTKKLIAIMPEAEKNHRVILEQFGRYPHRNASLGRETTAEEKEYLENGGETFGPPKDDEQKAKLAAKHNIKLDE